ncbi:diadenylate cyclase [Anaerovibrio lipolyticus DSM 3074]|uniref:Diadenylate cyclase n=1 Tax=Anaerovibrio lipolyticus DSM 3074 TaxID=1120997 RepID=A0A1M6DES5_9FIRM|nr:diadenylate cyclase CdaA [Anaerovibrio lipolyticus]SHI71766.1 diadenylate cyclase [Anaerovibrio lipolyticus DSM 3074]
MSLDLLIHMLDLPIPSQIHGLIRTVGFWDVVDILIVAVILYKVYEMLQDTRAITLVKGLIVLMIVTLVSGLLELHVISWLLQKTVTLLFVALPIVFQPELRRALERLGQGRFLGLDQYLDVEEANSLTNEIDKAVFNMADKKIGALLVIEKNVGINEIIDTGIKIEGLITTEFLMNVFIPNTPLHDGAAVIRGKRLVAAGCYLPLTENRSLSSELGTRHRAAIGLSEQCDAVIIIVSEETGVVSVAENGRIERYMTHDSLRQRIRPLFVKEKPSMKFKDIIANWRKKDDE